MRDDGPTFHPLGGRGGWRGTSPGGKVADDAGRLALAAAEDGGFEPVGSWLVAALDSEIHGCEWHRLELELDHLPAGSSVTLSTYTDDEPPPPDGPDPSLWSRALHVAGPMQPLQGGGTPRLEHEGLIQSREGRFLALRIELRGDGRDTPVLRAVRVHFPRESFLAELPAVYREDPESRWFLGRFLALFHTEWSALERRVEEIARYFDPRAVPEGPFLEYLARWLAQPLEGSWSWEQKRRLLAALPKILPHRGTPDALRRFLGLYLANLGAVGTGELLGFPFLVEGYRERRYVVPGIGSGGANLPGTLWSRRRVSRLQLGVAGRVGESRLVSIGSPPLDPFYEQAHRFRVFAPAAWLRTPADERLLRRAVEMEKPAHTRYELCLVEPRLRVGAQSTVGIDTIVGALPRARLPHPDDAAPAPSRPPRQRLGYDSVLSAGAPCTKNPAKSTPAGRAFAPKGEDG